MCTTLLLVSGMASKKRDFTRLFGAMLTTIECMVITYVYAVVVLTPEKDRKSLTYTAVVALIVWFSVIAQILVFAILYVRNCIGVRWSRNRTTERNSSFSSISR